jgi:hypothetical protein
MADGKVPLENNRILNAQEVAIKLCETTVPVDSSNTEYDLNRVLNVSEIKDMLTYREQLAYIGISDSKAIPNNGEIHRQLRLRRGASLSEAASSTTYATYTYVSSDWDGLTILDPFSSDYKGKLYSRYPDHIEAESGYYYMDANKRYVRIGELGNVDSGGIYVTVQYEQMVRYAVLATGDWTLDVRELWISANKPAANGLPLYLYQKKWYSTWSGEGTSVETKFSGVAIQYINAMKLYCKRYNNGSEQTGNEAFPSSIYVYTQNPVFTLSGTTSITSVAQTITINVSVQEGVDWTATSNQSWAKITSGSSGNGSGTITVSIENNGSYTSSRSVNIEVKDTLNGVSNYSRLISITQAATLRTPIYSYIHYNSAFNRFDVKNSSGGSTSLPFDLTVTITAYDNETGDNYTGTAIITSYSSSSSAISWNNGYPNYPVVTSVSFNKASPQASGAYNYYFEYKS